MISKADVFKEIPSPKEVENMKDRNDFLLLYKLGFMILRLTLDCRFNLTTIGLGKKITLKDRPQVKSEQVDNAVIKKSDNVEVKE